MHVNFIFVAIFLFAFFVPLSLFHSLCSSNRSGNWKVLRSFIFSSPFRFPFFMFGAQRLLLMHICLILGTLLSNSGDGLAVAIGINILFFLLLFRFISPLLTFAYMIFRYIHDIMYYEGATYSERDIDRCVYSDRPQSHACTQNKVTFCTF